MAEDKEYMKGLYEYGAVCVYLHFVCLSKSVCLLYKSMIVYIHAHIYVCVSIRVSV